MWFKFCEHSLPRRQQNITTKLVCNLFSAFLYNSFERFFLINVLCCVVYLLTCRKMPSKFLQIITEAITSLLAFLLIDFLCWKGSDSTSRCQFSHSNQSLPRHERTQSDAKYMLRSAQKPEEKYRFTTTELTDDFAHETGNVEQTEHFDFYPKVQQITPRLLVEAMDKEMADDNDDGFWSPVPCINLCFSFGPVA